MKKSHCPWLSRTNTGDGQIASLAQGGATIASYQYVGSRPARQVYPVPAVTTDSGYDIRMPLMLRNIQLAYPRNGP